MMLFTLILNFISLLLNNIILQWAWNIIDFNDPPYELWLICINQRLLQVHNDSPVYISFCRYSLSKDLSFYTFKITNMAGKVAIRTKLGHKLYFWFTNQR